MNSVITDTVMKAAKNIQEFKIPLKTWDGNPCIYILEKLLFFGEAFGLI